MWITHGRKNVHDRLTDVRLTDKNLFDFENCHHEELDIRRPGMGETYCDSIFAKYLW